MLFYLKVLYLKLLFFLLQKIKSLLSKDKIQQLDLLRLIMLYALRYESHSNNDLSGLVEALRRKGVSDKNRAVSSMKATNIILKLTFFRQIMRNVTSSININRKL